MAMKNNRANFCFPTLKNHGAKFRKPEMFPLPLEPGCTHYRLFYKKKEMKICSSGLACVRYFFKTVSWVIFRGKVSGEDYASGKIKHCTRGTAGVGSIISSEKIKHCTRGTAGVGSTYHRYFFQSLLLSLLVVKLHFLTSPKRGHGRTFVGQ